MAILSALGTAAGSMYSSSARPPPVAGRWTKTRRSIAASLLQAHGFTRVGNLVGGYRGWRDAGLPVVTDI